MSYGHLPEEGTTLNPRLVQFVRDGVPFGELHHRKRLKVKEVEVRADGLVAIHGESKDDLVLVDCTMPAGLPDEPVRARFVDRVAACREVEVLLNTAHPGPVEPSTVTLL